MTHPSGRSDTLAEPARPPAPPLLLNREAPARTARPLRAPSPAAAQKVFPGSGPAGSGAGTAGRRSPCGPAECMVPGVRAVRLEDPGRGRAEPSS